MYRNCIGMPWSVLRVQKPRTVATFSEASSPKSNQKATANGSVESSSVAVSSVTRLDVLAVKARL